MEDLEDSLRRNHLSSMPYIVYEAVACKTQKILFHGSVKKIMKQYKSNVTEFLI